jgi:hypothetical protein
MELFELDHNTVEGTTGAPEAATAFATSSSVVPASMITGPGVTETLATGTGGGGGASTLIVTVSRDAKPSLIAVTDTRPAVTARTRARLVPVSSLILSLEMLTIPGLVATQSTRRPARPLPFASATTARKTIVLFSSTLISRRPPRPTDATGTVTVIGVEPLTVPCLIVAVTFATPTPVAVTNPAGETVTIDAELVDQVNGACDTTAPFVSLAIARNCAVSPMDVRARGETNVTRTEVIIAVLLAVPVGAFVSRHAPSVAIAMIETMQEAAAKPTRHLPSRPENMR